MKKGQYSHLVSNKKSRKKSSKSYIYKIFGTLLLAYIIAGAQQTVLASTSTGFNLSDSQNCGGSKSTSSGFVLNDTICETGGGESTSSTYNLSAGASGLNQQDPYISFSLSANSINLGTLSASSIASGSVTTTITTTAQNGYTATITTDGSFRNQSNKDINAVTDGTVTAGSEEYGVRTAGTDGQLNSSDTGISTTPITYASHTAPIEGSITTVTFKASISPTTPSGTFHQQAIFIVTGNF